ncbi:hypothetical protein A5893_05125 [Pedobacter psychrophilus]|uniref:Bacterial Ig-like domain-containing protein n=1 Tax=Pedobacter psychrophilus TaxID=1826909 RepID=A0A179DGY0_9SPHI|nr:gliding motility-associated C-terminal domain-containing protein [Pedobacter psychrophilus]OAQ40336.1 hypothetical protein A5893_05125 [Pedobacter psychrophilus]
MKQILLFIAILISSFALKAQTVYFDQNFNSSTNYTTYAATSPSANQFNAIAVVGNTTVNTTNGKLQFVKTNTTGINRGGFTRSSNFAGAPTTGASFLKVSMEITITNNNADVPSGFQFTIGEVSGAPAKPGDGSTHSNIYINPTVNAGEFTIGTGSKSSKPFTGKKTIVWYINNSGLPVGYTDPNGAISTVENDAADVWVIDASTKTLAIDEEPATTPAINLKNFKLSNNPNFTATLDIDDILLTEEPVVKVKKIVSAGSVASVTVPLKTTFDRAKLPQTVQVTYDDQTTDIVGINWAPTTVYNQYTLGTYAATGTLIPINGTINPQFITVPSSVTVRDDIKLLNAFSPNGDGKNDTWVNPELSYYQEVDVQVYDKAGQLLFQSNDPLVGWDGKNKNGEIIAGSYFYIINVPSLILTKKGVVTVIK